MSTGSVKTVKSGHYWKPGILAVGAGKDGVHAITFDIIQWPIWRRRYVQNATSFSLIGIQDHLLIFKTKDQNIVAIHAIEESALSGLRHYASSREPSPPQIAQKVACRKEGREQKQRCLAFAKN
jgi:hypothetical protein